MIFMSYTPKATWIITLLIWWASRKRHCSERLNAEIDKEWLGKVFHVVITLGAKEEYIYWVRVMGLKLAWRWILYIKLCCTKKLGLLPTILYIGLVVSFRYLSFVQAWTAGLKVMWCVVQNVWDVMMVANVNMLYICFLRVFRSIAVALAPDCCDVCSH